MEVRVGETRRVYECPSVVLVGSIPEIVTIKSFNLFDGRGLKPTPQG